MTQRNDRVFMRFSYLFLLEAHGYLLITSPQHPLSHTFITCWPHHADLSTMGKNQRNTNCPSMDGICSLIERGRGGKDTTGMESGGRHDKVGRQKITKRPNWTQRFGGICKQSFLKRFENFQVKVQLWRSIKTITVIDVRQGNRAKFVLLE